MLAIVFTGAIILLQGDGLLPGGQGWCGTGQHGLPGGLAPFTGSVLPCSSH